MHIDFTGDRYIQFVCRLHLIMHLKKCAISNIYRLLQNATINVNNLTYSLVLDDQYANFRKIAFFDIDLELQINNWYSKNE